MKSSRTHLPTAFEDTISPIVEYGAHQEIPPGPIADQIGLDWETQHNACSAVLRPYDTYGIAVRAQDKHALCKPGHIKDPEKRIAAIKANHGVGPDFLTAHPYALEGVDETT